MACRTTPGCDRPNRPPARTDTALNPIFERRRCRPRLHTESAGTWPPACARRAICPATRPRWSRSWRPSSASRSSSRARPGVGKTELAKALSRYLDRTLVRLQCYEGLDEAKALYEWNYRKQLLRIQTESERRRLGGRPGRHLRRGVPAAAAADDRDRLSAEPVVLLIDEIDKTDQEFEAMLLELLSDFQISIPELGRIEARTQPVVLLTSNNTRELTEALKRRCLYLWLDYPELEHELEIVRLHSPELDETDRPQARRDRPAGPRARPQEAAEHRRVDRLGPRAAAARCQRHRREHVPGHDERDRQAPHRPGHGGSARRREARPGGDDACRRVAHIRPRPIYGGIPERPPGGFDGQLLAFAEDLREEGVALGTSEMLDAFEALRHVPWTEQRDFREALSATLAKSPDDRRIFELVFDRFFFRAAEAEAARAEHHRGARGERTRRQRHQPRHAAPADRRRAARRVGRRPLRDLARLAIAAFGRGEGSGVLGVDVQRIRRALGLRTEPQPDLPDGRPAPRGRARASSCGASSSTCGASSSAT